MCLKIFSVYPLSLDKTSPFAWLFAVVSKHARDVIFLLYPRRLVTLPFVSPFSGISKIIAFFAIPVVSENIIPLFH